VADPSAQDYESAASAAEASASAAQRSLDEVTEQACTDRQADLRAQRDRLYEGARTLRRQAMSASLFDHPERRQELQDQARMLTGQAMGIVIPPC
jgi:hypothetical protein